MKRSWFVFLMATLSASVACADELSLPIQDVSAVLDGSGSARVFFRFDGLPSSEAVLIDRAVIALPYSGSVSERTVELRICPVTSPWGASPTWDTPYDDELYARADLDLRRGAGVMSFDVTVALNAAREHGMIMDGFVMTLGRDRTRGIDADALNRLAGLEGAELKVTTTTLPSGRPPRAWVQRHGG